MYCCFVIGTYIRDDDESSTRSVSRDRDQLETIKRYTAFYYYYYWITIVQYRKERRAQDCECETEEARMVFGHVPYPPPQQTDRQAGRPFQLDSWKSSSISCNLFKQIYIYSFDSDECPVIWLDWARPSGALTKCLNINQSASLHIFGGRCCTKLNLQRSLTIEFDLIRRWKP